jgi:glycosyltransferase involved in cell wall biosynthesis
MPDLATSGTISNPVAATVARRLKIGISIWSFTPNTGGLQAHAQLLCCYLQKRGHDVTVITRSTSRVPQNGDYLFFNEPQGPVQVAGIPVSPLRISKMWNPVLWVILKCAARKTTLPMASRLYETVSARPAREAFYGYDIIHHIGHATALMGVASARAAKFHGIPFLVQPTAHPFHFGDTSLDLHLYRRAERLLVHTQYEQDYFREKGITGPIDVVGNGIEDRSDGQAERFLAKHGIKGPMILYVGRKSADKGYPLMIEAFKQLRSKISGADLVCMGPADANAAIESVPGVVELNFVSEDEKHDALAACTCLCVPSVGESFGLVYMEAGRYRKPVIGRDLPVLQELLGTDGAMLLGRRDDSRNTAELSADELASGILELLNNPELRRRMGEECHRRSEKFLWPQIVERFEASYYLAIDKHKSGKTSEHVAQEGELLENHSSSN